MGFPVGLAGQGWHVMDWMPLTNASQHCHSVSNQSASLPMFRFPTSTAEWERVGGLGGMDLASLVPGNTRVMGVGCLIQRFFYSRPLLCCLVSIRWAQAPRARRITLDVGS